MRNLKAETIRCILMDMDLSDDESLNLYDSIDFSCLDERLKKIIDQRMEGMTLREIGEITPSKTNGEPISKSQVRYLESRAIKKLRQHNLTKGVKS